MCIDALGKTKGACECLGRLKKCSVDAGCDKMSNEAIQGLCDVVGCSADQCQLSYPRSITCDWDSHVSCEFMLEQCQDKPSATPVKTSRYDVGALGLKRWLGDPIHIEQRKYAERCRCYGMTETFTQRTVETCEACPFGYEVDSIPGTCKKIEDRCGSDISPEDFRLGYDDVNSPSFASIDTDKSGCISFDEFRIALFKVNSTIQGDAGDTFKFTSLAGLNSGVSSSNYTSGACMSKCKSVKDRKDRKLLIAFDCAVCGDRVIMPGREECDDGNFLPFDGCNHCQIEPPDMTKTSIFRSEASHSNGFVVLIWNHTDKALQAARENLPHNVAHNEIIVTRRSCQVCEKVTITYR